MGTKIPQRLFFALWPSEVERALLKKQVNSIIPTNPGIRITPVDNIHCTLAFLGECSDQAAHCYLQAAEGIASKSFLISFDRIIFRKKQSMLWASVSSMPVELEMLNLHLQEAITNCGYKPEERKFIPHVTVARKIKKLPIIGEWRPVEWNIDRLVLLRSQRDIHGARYMPLGSWPLG